MRKEISDDKNSTQCVSVCVWVKVFYTISYINCSYDDGASRCIRDCRNHRPRGPFCQIDTILGVHSPQSQKNHMFVAWLCVCVHKTRISTYTLNVRTKCIYSCNHTKNVLRDLLTQSICVCWWRLVVGAQHEKKNWTGENACGSPTWRWLNIANRGEHILVWCHMFVYDESEFKRNQMQLRDLCLL